MRLTALFVVNLRSELHQTSWSQTTNIKLHVTKGPHAGGRHSPVKTKVYATAQEQMDAELEAAMAIDAAAADTGNGDSPSGRDGPMLELPGDGEGIDFDAMDVPPPQEIGAGIQQASDACMLTSCDMSAYITKSCDWSCDLSCFLSCHLSCHS